MNPAQGFVPLCHYSRAVRLATASATRESAVMGTGIPMLKATNKRAEGLVGHVAVDGSAGDSVEELE